MTYYPNNPNGRNTAANSAPHVLSTEDKAALDLVAQGVGNTNDAAAANDTATSSSIGLFKRIAQRLSSLIALFPTSLGAGGGLKIDGSGTVLPVADTAAAASLGNLEDSLGLVTSTLAPNASAAPYRGVLVGGSDGANMRHWLVDSNRHGHIVLQQGSAYVGKFRISDNTNDLTLFNLTNSKPIPAAIVDANGNQITSFGSGGPTYGTPVDFAINALNSLAASATVGWKSARISNLTTKAKDYLIGASIDFTNVAPGSDKCLEVWVIPWFYDGTTWFAASGGTATLPTDGDASYTILAPHDFVMLGILSYSTQDMKAQGAWLLSSAFNGTPPQGFSLFVRNNSGAAVAASGNKMTYIPIT